MGVSKKKWYPQIINPTRVFPFKPSILGITIFGNTHMDTSHIESQVQGPVYFLGSQMKAGIYIACRIRTSHRVIAPRIASVIAPVLAERPNAACKEPSKACKR